MTSDNLQQVTVDSVWYRQHKYWKNALASLAVIVILLLWVALQDREFEFDFGQITDDRDTKYLLALHDDLNAVREWKPWNVLKKEEDRKKCGAKWKRVFLEAINGLEGKEKPANWSSLFRSQDESEESADTTEQKTIKDTQLDLYNSLVDFFVHNARKGDFEQLQKESDQEVKNNRLQECFDTALRKWRQERFERLVGDKRRQAGSRLDDLLQEHGGRLFPTPEDRWRLTSNFRRFLGKRDYDEMKAWVEAYCDSCQRHLQPVAEFRKSLQTTHVLPFNPTKRESDGTDLKRANEPGPDLERSDELGLVLSLSHDGSEVSRNTIDDQLQAVDPGAELQLRFDPLDRSFSNGSIGKASYSYTAPKGTVSLITGGIKDIQIESGKVVVTTSEKHGLATGDKVRTVDTGFLSVDRTIKESWTIYRISDNKFELLEWVTSKDGGGTNGQEMASQLDGKLSSSAAWHEIWPHEVATETAFVDLNGTSYPVKERVNNRDIEIFSEEAPKKDIGEALVRLRSRSSRKFETGIRINGLILNPSQAAKSDTRIAHQWPPKSCFVDSDVLLDLLRDLGMPRGFRLARAKATPEKKTSNVVVLSCQVVHPQLPDYSHSLEVSLGADPIQVTIGTLREKLAGLTKSAEFKASMKKLSRVHEVTVAENRQVEDEHQWRCTLEYPFGKVSLDLAISPAAELRFFGQPTPSECRQIIDELLKPPDLQGFQELAHVLSIDGCEVDPNSGDLKGTLSIHGTLIDSNEVIWDVPWTIRRANRTSTLDIDRKTVLELKGLKKRLSQQLGGLKTIAPATAKSVTGLLKDYLEKIYPHLVGSIAHERLKKSDGSLTNRIVLRLLIGDWPELVLVSREMTADNIKAEVDRLLSEKIIKEQAKKQWKTARTTVSFLGVERQLTGWNPYKGEATVRAKIELPIGKPDRSVEIGQWAELLKIRKAVGGNPKRWDRFIKNRDNTEVHFSERELCRRLGPTLGRVERELSDALSELVQGKVEVTAERNGFGPGRWLQAHPPAIRIAIEVPVPLLPFRVRAGQILCEGRDPFVHFPEEWTATYLRTFPVPLTPPAIPFSVSDPTVRVNFKKKELGLGCKVTPLAPPLDGVDLAKSGAENSKAAMKAAEKVLKRVGIKTSEFTLRPDNLWLHLAYLEIELNGALKEPAFGAKGHLQMLDFYRAAGAELSIATSKNPSLNAHLETGRFPVPYIAPEISGTLQLDGRGLEMDTAFNLVGAHVDGRMSYQTGDPNGGGFAELRIDGQVRLPFIGLADAHVVSDPTMEQIEITTAAVTILPFGRFRYRFRAHLDRRSDPPVSGYDLHIEQISPTGAPLGSFSWVGSSLRELDDEEIADAVMGSSQGGNGNSGKNNNKARKQLSVEENKLLAELPVGTPHKQPERPLPPNKGKRGGPDLVRNVGNDVYEVKREKKDRENNFRLVDTRRPESEQKFNLPITNYDEFWFWESGTRAIFLFHSQEEEKTILVEFERVKDHLGKKLGPIKRTQNVFPDDEKREFDPYEDDLSGEATMHYVARQFANEPPSEPERVKSGFLVRWKEDSGTLGASYIFKRKDGGRGRYRFRAKEISEEVWSKAGFLDLLRECRQDKSSFVVEADIAKGLAVFVQPEKKIKDCDRISIVSTKMKANPVEVLLTHFKSGSSQRLRAAQLVASRLQKPKPGARVFVGEAGLAIVVDQEPIEFHAFDGDGDWFAIDRTQFTTWKRSGKDEEHPNSRHLPVGFRTKEQRDHWWRYRRTDLLRKLLTSLRELRQERRPEKRWGANPLGLLQALAQSR